MIKRKRAQSFVRARRFPACRFPKRGSIDYAVWLAPHPLLCERSRRREPKIRFHWSQRRRSNMALQVGSQAPDFALKSNKMADVKLSELRGSNVLLLFVPLAFTKVCTGEFCSMRDALKDYEGLNCKVFGVSTD